MSYATATETAPGSSLTDFTWLIDLSKLPQDWWDAVDTSDGTKGRCYLWNGSTETEVAADWIDFDSVGETGFVRVLRDVASASAQTLRIYPPKAANSSYGVSDTYGQYNAYDSDWDGYWQDCGTDQTGNQNNATGSGGVTIGGSTGKVGAATDFDGVNDILTLPNVGATLSSAHTVLLWANLDSNSSNQYFVSGDSLTAYIYWIVGGTHVLTQRRSSSDSVAVFQSSGSTGTWHHLGYQVSGSAGGSVSYVDDGSLVADSFGSGSGTVTSATDIEIGGRSSDNNRNLDGRINELQLHGTERSADWIAQEYDQTNDNATFWGAWSWESGSVTVNPDDLTHAHTVESPTVTQSHQVSPVDLTHSHEIASPTVSQVHAVAPAGLVHAHEIDSPTITQAHQVTPDDLQHAHEIESPTVTVYSGDGSLLLKRRRMLV